MARQRHVYPTDEIPHLWANQTQADARNPQGNLYFRGPMLFSYRDSFAAAMLHKNAKGETLALINSYRYSNTTAGHLGGAWTAVSQFNRMHVARPDVKYPTEHRSNAAGVLQVAFDALQKAKRALQSDSVRRAMHAAIQAVNDHNFYVSFFGLDIAAVIFPQAEWDIAMQRVVRIENPDPASADKRQRDAAKRKARKELQESLAVDCWRTNWRLAGAFGDIPVGNLRDRWNRNLYGEVMLRLDGDELVTSMGARIPAAHAPIIWKQVERCVAKGESWEKNGHTIHAGAYSIDRIEPDGTMKAGCHTIPHSELRVMARALGLAQ